MDVPAPDGRDGVGASLFCCGVEVARLGVEVAGALVLGSTATCTFRLALSVAVASYTASLSRSSCLFSGVIFVQNLTSFPGSFKK